MLVISFYQKVSCPVIIREVHVFIQIKKENRDVYVCLWLQKKLWALLPYTFNACSTVAVADVFDLYRMVSWQNMVPVLATSLLTHPTTWLNIWSVCHFLTLPPFLYCYYCCLNHTINICSIIRIRWVPVNSTD